MTKVYVPRDAAALSVGAEEVAGAIEREAAAYGQSVTLVRNGSRGLFWLEPMVEVETPGGRIAYGPVAAKDVPGLFTAGSGPSAGFLEGAASPLCLGPTEEIPYLKRQERLTFARCGLTDPLSIADYKAHGGYEGLGKALALPGADVVKAVTDSGLRGRGGAGFPTGIKWKTVHDAKAETWGGALVADGKLFLGNKRELLILAAGRDLKVLGEVRLGSPAYSTPIAANGALYVASQKYLWAVAGGESHRDLIPKPEWRSPAGKKREGGQWYWDEL